MYNNNNLSSSDFIQYYWSVGSVGSEALLNFKTQDARIFEVIKKLNEETTSQCVGIRFGTLDLLFSYFLHKKKYSNFYATESAATRFLKKKKSIFVAVKEDEIRQVICNFLIP